jgi:hypothetical protein
MYFFSLLQNNVLNGQAWTIREQLRIAIVTWIERTYDPRRRQGPGPFDAHRVRSHHEHDSRTGCVTTTCHLSLQQTLAQTPTAALGIKLTDILDSWVFHLEGRFHEISGVGQRVARNRRYAVAMSSRSGPGVTIGSGRT